MDVSSIEVSSSSRVVVVKCLFMYYEGGEVVRVIYLKDSQGVVKGMWYAFSRGTVDDTGAPCVASVTEGLCEERAENGDG